MIASPKRVSSFCQKKIFINDKWDFPLAEGQLVKQPFVCRREDDISDLQNSKESSEAILEKTGRLVAPNAKLCREKQTLELMMCRYPIKRRKPAPGFQYNGVYRALRMVETSRIETVQYKNSKIRERIHLWVIIEH